MAINPVVLKGLMKTLKSLIPPDQIKEAANSLITSAIDFKNEIPLDPDNGEIAVTGMIYEVDGLVYTAIAILNCQNHIVRFANVRPLNDVIENLIKKM